MVWAAVNVAHIESPRHTRREAYNVGIWACGLQAPRCGTAAAGEPFLQRILRVFCGLGGRWAPVFKWVFRPLWFPPVVRAGGDIKARERRPERALMEARFALFLGR